MKLIKSISWAKDFFKVSSIGPALSLSSPAPVSVVPKLSELLTTTLKPTLAGSLVLVTLIVITTFAPSASAEWRITDHRFGGKVMSNDVRGYQTGDMNERFESVQLSCSNKTMVIYAVSAREILMVGNVRVGMFDGDHKIKSMYFSYDPTTNPRWKTFPAWSTDHDNGRAFMVTELLNRERLSFHVFEDILHTSRSMLIDNRNFGEVWAEYQALDQCKQIPEKKLVKAQKRFDKRLAKQLKKLEKGKAKRNS